MRGVAAVLLCLIVVISAPLASGSSSGRSSSVPLISNSRATAVLDSIQRFGAWWMQESNEFEVQPLLPHARPLQPWPYRHLNSAVQVDITVTESYAMQATVVHAPLKGITAEMLEWWLGNIEGDAPYAGHGQIWSKYLQWHPRDHIHHLALATAAPGRTTTSGSSSSSGVLAEICEYFMCREAGGYTTANYHPGPQHADDYVIKEVTQMLRLDSEGCTMTVPTQLGIGSSLWQLQHSWQDSPGGLLLTSTQTVGVVQPGWRPLWYARWRNALVRGMFARSRDPVWMLEQWLHHCIEEFGNLEHILPGLFSAAQQQQPVQPHLQDTSGEESEAAASNHNMGAEEL